MNELAALLIGALWVMTGRGLNLCFVIFIYYLFFIFISYFTLPAVDLSDLSDVTFYYISQSWLDVSIAMACLLISSKNKKIIILARAYAAIIATSLLFGTLAAVNSFVDVELIYLMHEARQYVSIPLDVLFAALGSGVYGRYVDDRRLRTGKPASYNRNYHD